MREEIPGLSVYENSVLTMLSIELLDGKRKHELILLDLLLHNEKVKQNDYLEELKKSTCLVDDATLNSVIRVLDLTFFTQSDRQKYGSEPVVMSFEDNKHYAFNNKLKDSLNENQYFRHLVKMSYKVH